MSRGALAFLRTGAVMLPLILSGLPARAQEEPADASPGDDAPDPATASKRHSGRKVVLFPADDVFPVYIADPHRPGNAATVHFYTHVGIADSSDVRTGLKAGGRFGVLRIDPSVPEGRSWQLSIDAGLDAQFDSYNKLDDIGWDGNYGLTFTTASGGPWSFKLGLLHCSSHVGDEYMERTGRQRIGYTREEVAFGIGYRLSRSWRAYGEAGVATKQGTEEQAPWRAQAGLEYESRPRLFGGHFAWYLALDLASWQERDWRLDTVLQGGIESKAHGRTWRIGGEYSNGRPPLGEFFQDTESRLTLGIWVDL